MNGFDARTALRWLAAEAVSIDGAVPSWVNPERPGYPYPEAAAIVLRLFRQQVEPDWTPVADRIAARLWRDVDENRVGKHGRDYAFDRGVVLAAVGLEDPIRAHSVRRQTLAALETEGHFDDPRDPAARWSTVRGPHLLKVAVGLVTASRALDRPTEVGPLSQIRVIQSEAGRIETPPHRSTYVHAHCYAAEGLLAMAHTGCGRPGAQSKAAAAVGWLARIQRPDGAIPAWHDGSEARGPWPADVCAQAIRLWCLLEPVRYREQVVRGIAYLDRLATRSGAVRYHEDSNDLNTWATAFAIQAVRWAYGGQRDPLALL